MTGRVGADLDQLHELRRLLGTRADDVADGAAAVGWTIDRFRDGSTEYVPPLPPHDVQGAALAQRLDDLGHRVARTHAAMVAADRWVGTSAALWAIERKGEKDTVVDGGRAVRSLWDERGDLRAGLARTDARHAPWLRGLAGRTLAVDTLADVRHVVGRGLGSHQSPDRVVGWLGRTADRFRSSRAGSVTRLGSRLVGGAGFVLGALDTVDAVRAGDEARAWTSGLGTVAGAAMLSGFPPVQVAGAVVSGGLLVYEYRDEIADGARVVGRGLSTMAGAAADFLTDGLF